MKFYETHYDEYIHSTNAYNLHKNISDKIQLFPSSILEILLFMDHRVRVNIHRFSK